MSRPPMSSEATSASRYQPIPPRNSASGGGAGAPQPKISPPRGARPGEIGRAAGRGRGERSGGAVSFKKKKKEIQNSSNVKDNSGVHANLININVRYSISSNRSMVEPIEKSTKRTNIT